MIALREAFQKFGDNFKVNRTYQNGEIKDKLENANIIGSAIKPYMDFIKLEKKNESTLEEQKLFNNVLKEYHDALVTGKSVPKSEFPYLVDKNFIGTKGTKPVYLKLLSSGKMQSKVFLSYSRSNHYLFIDNSKNGNLFIYRNYSTTDQEFDNKTFQPYRVKVLEHQNYYYRDPETNQYDREHPIMVTRIDIEKERRSSIINDYDIKLMGLYNNVYTGDPSKSAAKRYKIPNVYIFKDNDNNIFLYKIPKNIDIDKMSIPEKPGEVIKIKSASIAEDTPLTRNDLYTKDPNKTTNVVQRQRKGDKVYKTLVKRPVYKKIELPKEAKKYEIFNVENFGGLIDAANTKPVDMAKLPDESIEAFKERERKKEEEKLPEKKEEKLPLTIKQRDDIYDTAKNSNLMSNLKAFLNDDMNNFYTEELKEYNDLYNAYKDIDKIVLSYKQENLKETEALIDKISNKDLKDKIVKFIARTIKTDKIDLLKKLIVYRRELDKLQLSAQDVDYLIGKISTQEFFNKYKRESKIFDYLINKLLVEKSIKNKKDFDIAIQSFLK
jgi:hypothetical protein